MTTATATANLIDAAREIKLSDRCRAFFLMLADDAGNWSGTPMLGGNVLVGPAEKGFLTNLKKHDLLSTVTESDGNSFVYFHALGVVYAALQGDDLYRAIQYGNDEMQAACAEAQAILNPAPAPVVEAAPAVDPTAPPVLLADLRAVATVEARSRFPFVPTGGAAALRSAFVAGALGKDLSAGASREEAEAFNAGLLAYSSERDRLVTPARKSPAPRAPKASRGNSDAAILERAIEILRAEAEASRYEHERESIGEAVESIEDVLAAIKDRQSI